MIKWTTPTLKCTIPNDLQLDYVLLRVYLIRNGNLQNEWGTHYKNPLNDSKNNNFNGFTNHNHDIS